MHKKFYFKFLILLTILTLSTLSGTLCLRAATTAELQNKISSQQAEIDKLDKEIANYRLQISKTGTEKASLGKELETLELARKKLQADISVTKNKISITDSNIRNLNQDIRTTTEKIIDNRKVLATALRLINDQEKESLVEILTGSHSTTEVWDNLSHYQSLNEQAADLINTLNGNKRELEINKSQKETEKKNLSSLEERLTDQRKITEQTQQEKDALLAKTKSKESAYQQLLADRLKKKQQIEAEIAKAEAELKYILDPSSLPKTAKGALSWPVGKVIITQGFGQTAFSQSAQGQSVYNGKGHNGIDLGGATGDNIYTAESGQVVGVGDTDLTCKGASYGKWILIRHNNGLTTLYAHLSAIKVSEGQTVTVGQTIGYLGSTGYSTGPHLHFTTYASGGVEISSLKSKVPGCGTYRLPIASYSAYLNPLNYLAK
ncbi:MAG TPA: peptidoglycan DD-metalloendopeptidase family protein [Candidatus Paceibacterota bacterium]|nr:peptidoglycan DD-metalloendopeptidase family protein [Candidatus Paceibacterota bacterium]